jgi:hypothetical protein
MYSFKDFLTVDYTGTDEELLALQSKKRKLESTEEEEVDEAMSLSQRLKMKKSFKKNKAKIMMGRKKAAKKHADPEHLKKRAEKQARGALEKKLTGGKSKADLSFAERGQLEKRMAKKSAAIKKLAKKLLPAAKAKDKAKFKKSAPTEE